MYPSTSYISTIEKIELSRVMLMSWYLAHRDGCCGVVIDEFARDSNKLLWSPLARIVVAWDTANRWGASTFNATHVHAQAGPPHTPLRWPWPAVLLMCFASQLIKVAAFDRSTNYNIAILFLWFHQRGLVLLKTKIWPS